MRTLKLIGALVFLGSILVSACTMKPPERMDAYLGPTAQVERGAVPESLKVATGPVDVGLLLINDTSERDSAPALSDEAKRFLTDRVREQLDGKLPLRVVKVLPSADIAPTRDPQQFARLAQNQGVDHLLLAIFSSAESEIPIFLALDGAPEQGGTRPKVSGFEAINYA